MEPKPTPPTPPLPDIPFVNEMRLTWPLWLATVGLLAAAIILIPRVWKKVEPLDAPGDYRIPYSLSKDYWLYQRRIDQTKPDDVLVIGDSVVWGEYVAADGTLTHFLNASTNISGLHFVNCGVNGLYPLAIEGLLGNYAHLHNRKIILHCNVLWMSSPKADLKDPKPQSMNHARLLPQFTRIPSYKADANERLSVLIEEHVQFMSWVTHLQSAYYNDKSIPNWTLASDDNDKYPNSYKNPLSQITLRLPSPFAPDPQRGPQSARHKKWGEQSSFDWLSTTNSLQWAAFARTLEMLKRDGNHVVVVVGPFNEHIITAESKAGFVALRNGIVDYLKASQTQFVAPETLPSEMYADASHPLTEGYELLARRLIASEAFGDAQ
jgi:hypothetical protein